MIAQIISSVARGGRSGRLAHPDKKKLGDILEVRGRREEKKRGRGRKKRKGKGRRKGE